MDYVTALYKCNKSSIEVKLSITEKEVWLNQDDMAFLYDCVKSTISKWVKIILNENSNEYKRQTFLHERNNYRRFVLHYNLPLVLEVGRRINSCAIYSFEKWCNSLLNSNSILSEYDGQSLYLSINQLADIFNTPREKITALIKSIYKSGELQKANTTKEDDEVTYYNSDVLIYLSFRVDSFKGIEIRTRLINSMRGSILKVIFDGKTAINTAKDG